MSSSPFEDFDKKPQKKSVVNLILGYLINLVSLVSLIVLIIFFVILLLVIL